jgi:hypothetical protein
MLGSLCALGVAMAAYLAIIGYSWGQRIVQPNPPTIRYQQPKTDERGTEKLPSSGWSLSDKIAAGAAAAAALQFLALIIIIAVTMRNGRRQLRAYVFVSSAKIVYNNNQIPEAHVVIKNSGQTPAYGMIYVSGFAFDTWPPPSHLDLVISDKEFSAPNRSKMDLPPGDVTIPITAGTRRLTPAQQAGLVAGTHVCYAYGEVRYRDAFGKKRWTKYRSMMGGPVSYRYGQMVACEEGNEST